MRRIKKQHYSTTTASTRLRSSTSGRKIGLRSRYWVVWLFVGTVLLFGGFDVFLLKLSVDVWRQANLQQVYLFVHQNQSNVDFILDSVLIKSAVISSPSLFVQFQPSPELQITKTNQPDDVRLAATNYLNLPIDQVYYLDQPVKSSMNLVYHLWLTPMSWEAWPTQLITRVNLTYHLITSSSSSLDPQQATTDLSTAYLERSIVSNGQACSVAVINTTQINGLAAQIGRLLEGSGVYIVRLSSNDLDLNTSLVKVDVHRPSCQAVAAKLKGILPQSKPVETDDVLKDYRADIVLFLGRNLAQYKLTRF